MVISVVVTERVTSSFLTNDDAIKNIYTLTTGAIDATITAQRTKEVIDKEIADTNKRAILINPQNEVKGNGIFKGLSNNYKNIITAITSNQSNANVFIINNQANAGETVKTLDVAIAESVESLMTSDIDVGILLAPGFENISGSADDDITTFNKIEALCQSKKMMFFFDVKTGTAATPSEIITAAKAHASRFTSARGHSSCFIGDVRYKSGTTTYLVPLSAIAAAIALKATEEGVEIPPAGVNFPILNETGGLVTREELSPYFYTEGNLKALWDAKINLAQSIPKYGVVLWSSVTLSQENMFLYINTRAIINRVTKQLEEALLPFLLGPFDPRGETTEQVKLTITSVLERAYNNNYLNGATSADAYRIVELPPKDNKITIQVYATFVGTTKEIEVFLYITRPGEIQ
ncbi:MAG: hypothetical protein F6K55_03430 [Moorea sp. SIO4A3]|nr:hypothetical protein [Moorena sp. SIO4A3]